VKLAGEFLFDAGVKEVWDALFDPAVLAAVLPGCEKLELVDGSYVGEIKVKVGPIQGKFSGKVDLLDQVEPTSYRMVIDGRGAQGFVKATATIVLEPAGTGTRIRYDSDAQIGGKIASVGQRLVETSARAIVKQSLEGLGENIKIRAEVHRARATAEPPPPAASPSADAPAASPSADAPAAAAEPAPEAHVDPPIEYKRADAGKLAATVAKEVSKTLAPVIAIIIYLLVR